MKPEAKRHVSVTSPRGRGDFFKITCYFNTCKPHDCARTVTGFALLAARCIALLLVFAPATMAEENVRLQCTPRTFQVVPGEPMRLELTVRADSAAPIHLRVPAHPLLTLRALEKLPMQRTQEGLIVHKRVVIWQALEPGWVKMKAISVETKGRKLLFPEITITVRDPSP